jgi:hypothetical protein
MAEHLKFSRPREMTLNQRLDKISTRCYIIDDISRQRIEAAKQPGEYGIILAFGFMIVCISIAWMLGAS